MNGILLMHIDFITLLCLMIYDTLNNWICCYVTVVENYWSYVKNCYL